MDVPNQLYRRPLPDSCISFSSNDGITIFREALLAGHMSCYFKLAEQFRTQDEPAFCGLSTLVMVLNALSVDPGRVWKGVWRWYHESMLDCCTPLDEIKKDGISFQQLVCLARCNGLDVKTTYLTQHDEDCGIAKFRETLHAVSQVDDSFIILNYFRPILGQTGVGHHSPMGGYHPGRDLLLIMDTARFKYPPHWVPVSLVWDAMWAVADPAAGERRGYMIVSHEEVHRKLMMFKLTPEFSTYLSSANEENTPCFVRKWIKQISHVSSTSVTSANQRDGGSILATSMVASGKCCSSTKDELPDSDDGGRDKAVVECAKILLELLSEIPDGQFLLTTAVDLKCVYEESEKHASIVSTLLDEIEATDVYRHVHKRLQVNVDARAAAKRLVNLDELSHCCPANTTVAPCADECTLVHRVNHGHFITMFLLSWPHGPDRAGWQPCMQWCELKENTLNYEIAILRKQIFLLLPQQADNLPDSFDVS